MRIFADADMRREQRLAERDITLEVTDAALDLLGEAGFDPIYGARPLKRAIQQDLENSLAQDILAGKIGPDDVVTADAEESRIVFSVISESK